MRRRRRAGLAIRIAHHAVGHSFTATRAPKAGPAPVVTLAGEARAWAGDRSAPASPEESESQRARVRMPRTVAAYHSLPPCAVGTRSALSDAAITRSVSPRARWRWIRRTTFCGTVGGRPRWTPCAFLIAIASFV